MVQTGSTGPFELSGAVLIVFNTWLQQFGRFIQLMFVSSAA